MNSPNKMKAIALDNYNPNLIRVLRNMKVVDIPIPKPEAGQVLVKVKASPINPSDIAFLRGGYNIVKSLPAIPGFEGVGKIVEVGKGIDKSVIGERVAFFIQDDNSGAWAEYAIVGKNDFIIVDNELPLEQAACLFVNPFTAYALFEHLSDNKHQAIIQSAANGQVGQFIRYFAKEHDIEVINLVRKSEQVEMLINAVCKYVLDTNDEKFEDKLTQLSSRLNATAAIDAVGGELSGKILNAMPAGSEVVVYGGLSGMAVSGINTLDLIFKNKVLSGFNLNDWIADKSKEDFSKISGFIQTLFMDKKLETKIHKPFEMDDFYNAMRAYIADMSAGKVLLKMGD